MDTINRILQLVQDSGLTAKEYAINAGLGAGNITDWKTGRSKPSVESLQKIALYANVDLNWLVGETYFKNEVEYVNLLGYCTGSILSMSVKNCFKLEDTINEMLQGITSNKDDFINQFSLDLRGAMQKTIEVLYNDFKEHNAIYSILYGSKSFSLISFLSYTSLKYGQTDVSLDLKIKNRINELRGVPSLIQNKNNHQLYSIPIIGKIAAGQPILAEEYIEGYLPVDPNIYGMSTSEHLFYLRVSGESMNQKVKNGDYALIHKQDYAENGDIVVAIVNGDDEATLKRYKKLNEQFILLEPMSSDPSIEAITVDLKDTNFKIIGKAIGQFGKF